MQKNIESRMEHTNCIIPVSGGKDSHYQALYARDELGLNPLLINFIPRDLVELGRRNIENLKSLGFDYFEFTPNPKIYRKLAKIGLTEFGDVTWARTSWIIYSSSKKLQLRLRFL